VENALADGQRKYFNEAEKIYTKALDETEESLGLSGPRFKVMVFAERCKS